MRVGAATNVGKVRAINEDAYWYNDSCFVVCDGMGGHQAGEVASALAVDTVKRFSFDLGKPTEQVKQVIEQAHERILREASDKGLNGMGTTITLGLMSADAGQLTIGHVGDSRLYLYRGETLTQLTKDHSVAAELLRNGTLTEQEAETHPQRHVLTQALGGGTISVEIACHRIHSEDKLLFCTDGLSGVVSPAEMSKALELENPQDSAETLVELANSLGGPDNITVLVVRFP